MPGRVLIIEDNDATREFLSMSLSDEGYEVASAMNGAAGLELVATFAPDLILLDLRMPLMNGAAFIEAYRRTPVPHVPIILMTASIQSASFISSLDIAQHIVKPFDLNVLLELLKSFLP